jgi:hypothetical protein
VAFLVLTRYMLLAIAQHLQMLVLQTRKWEGGKDFLALRHHWLGARGLEDLPGLSWVSLCSRFEGAAAEIFFHEPAVCVARQHFARQG